MNNQCNIVKDLLPLYVENMVSADTKAFVSAHLKTCPSCRAECKGMKTSIEETFSVKQPSDAEFTSVLKGVNKRLRRYCILPLLIVLVFGIAFSWDQILVNFIFMPLIGVFGYLVFRWKAIWILPPVTVLAYAILEIVISGYGMLRVVGVAAFYTSFIALGVVLSGFLHYAFSTDASTGKKLVMRVTAIVCALILCQTAVYGAGLYLGTPLGYLRAWMRTEELLKQEHAGTDYRIEYIQYYHDGTYTITVAQPSMREDTQFSVIVDLHGKYRGDNYQALVADRGNMVKKLNDNYYKKCNQFFNESSFPYKVYNKNSQNVLKFDYDDGQVPEKALVRSDLVLGQEYNLFSLGKTNGYINVQVYDSDCSVENAAKILLDFKTRTDEWGLSFYHIDYTLYPTGEGEGIHAPMLYREIYKEGLEDRIRRLQNF